MKRNGFTLIELLAVLVIIGLLALLLTPAVFNSVEQFKDEALSKQYTSIEMAAEDWVSDHLEVMPHIFGDTIYITLGDLKAEGYIEKDLQNPKNNNYFPNDMTIEIMRKKNDYKITCNTTSGTASLSSNLKSNGPSIQLKGDNVVTVNAGTTYTDAGATASDASKNNITSSMTISYKKGNTVVSSITTTAGSVYTIYYKVTSNSVTQVVTRNVVVVNPV